jgi:hypothetical protein
MIQEDARLAQLTWREAFGLLGAGAVASGVVAPAGRSTLCAAGQASRAATAGFPQGAIVRRILKNVPPSALGPGAMLFHEHLSLTSVGRCPHLLAKVVSRDGRLERMISSPIRSIVPLVCRPSSAA